MSFLFLTRYIRGVRNAKEGAQPEVSDIRGFQGNSPDVSWRNAINLGLPILIAPGITQKVEHNDALEIDLKEGIIKNMKTNEEIKAVPLPVFVLETLNEGGLIPYLRKKLNPEKKEGIK